MMDEIEIESPTGSNDGANKKINQLENEVSKLKEMLSK